MKKAIIFLLLFSMTATLFLPSCTNTEAPDPTDNTTTSADDPTNPDASDTTTTVGGGTSDIPAEKTVEEVIAEIDALTNKRIDEIKNTKDEITVTGTKYYVSEDGNDANDGKSPEKAWKTMSNLNSKSLSSGDAVLFKRGDTFRGHFTTQNGVTYAAYGEGEKPILIANEITDGTDALSWSLYDAENNIWVYHKDVADQGNIIFNNGDGCAYKVTPSYKDGNPYVQLTTKAFDVKKELDINLEFVCLADSIMSGGVPAVGDSNCSGKLYLRCDDGNPGEVYDSIEFSPRVNTISVYSNNVTIDNLCLRYAGAHAVGGGTCTGLKVTNCEFGWIGGTVQYYQDNGNPVRYGNGVEIYGGATNFEVINNYIYQVYDAGITHQFGKGSENVIMQNIRYTDNVILYCSYSIEYFLGEKTGVSTTRYMENIVVENNIMRYAGFGFGNQRSDKTNPAHIKGWDHANYIKDGSQFIIRNNIMDRSRYMMVHCGAENLAYFPTFEDNIWVQYRVGSSSLGKFGLNPTSQREFTKRNFESLGVEKDPEIYTINSKDQLWDLPF